MIKEMLRKRKKHRATYKSIRIKHINKLVAIYTEAQALNLLNGHEIITSNAVLKIVQNNNPVRRSSYIHYGHFENENRGRPVSTAILKTVYIQVKCKHINDYIAIRCTPMFARRLRERVLSGQSYPEIT